MFISAWFHSTGLLDFTLSVVYGGRGIVKHREGLSHTVDEEGMIHIN